MTEKKKSFRVYFVTHHDGRCTGRLLRTWESFFDGPPPAAYAEDQASALRELETQLIEMLATDSDTLERYLWDEHLQLRLIQVPVHAQTLLDKRPLIGKKRIPLRIGYAWSRTGAGAYHVLVPRFGWSFVLEDLETAPAVLQNAVSSGLLGSKPRWIYDFRFEGPESIEEWSPELLSRWRPPDEEEETDAARFPVLAQVAEDLVDRARRVRPSHLIELEDALPEALALVMREPPASILIVGGPGVGKTSLVLRLARRLAELGRRDKGSRVPRLWRGSADRILAGMIYLGQWQERCLKLVRELSGEGDLFYVEGLPSLLRPQVDGSSIAELLFPALAAEEISLIAECTESELEHARRRFPAFVERFRLIRLAEPLPTEMSSILARGQAQRKGRTLHPQALRLLVRHLRMFQKSLLFPGKGFRFLDWLAKDSGAGQGSVLYPADVSRAFARYAGLPLELISDDSTMGESSIAQALARGVVGQEEACLACARVLARFKAGLNDPERPVGSLLFVGPTGVGKTELAKRICGFLFGGEERLVRLDMSEYAAPGSAARLLESRPGGSSFAERLRQQPLSLVLLDEIEKAHPEVYDLLLGMLGEGRLTDEQGRLVDLRMALVIMTSNLGSGDAPAAGFGAGVGRGDPLRRVREYFRPEFVGRLDSILAFRPLGEREMLGILELELEKLRSRSGLQRRRLRLRVTPEAKAWLAREGVDPRLGARPLKRLLEERVVTPLAVLLSREPGLKERELVLELRGGTVALRSPEVSDEA